MADKVEQTLSGGEDDRTTLEILRAVAGLTQDELAHRAGVTRQTIARLESRRHRPRRGTMLAVAAALGHEDPYSVFPAEAILR